MTITQPTPVATFIKARLAADIDTQLATLAPDAVVHDDGNRYDGIAAIKGWMTRTKSAYTIAYTVGDTTATGDDTDVAIEIAGDFPGSPVPLHWTFTVAGDHITALTIAA
jgi:hypothetical protein